MLRRYARPDAPACSLSSPLTLVPGRARDGLYEPVLADSEREAVADLLQYLENVRASFLRNQSSSSLTSVQRGETDFFSGEPLRALSTLVFSENIDLQRSASLTFAEITERGMSPPRPIRSPMMQPICKSCRIPWVC